MYMTKVKTGRANSSEYALGNLRPYILALMEQEGRDFSICEQCLEPTNDKWEFHHNRYEGATYYDLEIVCLSCNRLEKNCGLA